MFDIRFHIISLIAGFLALGIGILIGSTLVSDEIFIREQKKLIDRLETDFALLRQENIRVREEIKDVNQRASFYEQFAEQAFPLLIENRLEEMRVAVVAENIDSDSINQLTEALALAGARLQLFMLEDIEGFQPGSTRDLFQSEDGNMSKNMPELETMEGLGQLIGKELSAGNFKLLKRIQELGFLTFQGDYQNPPDAVIVFGENQEKESKTPMSSFKKGLVNFLKSEQSVKLVEMYREGKHLAASVNYNEAGIFINKLETVPGRTLLVFSISSEALSGEGREFFMEQLKNLLQ